MSAMNHIILIFLLFSPTIRALEFSLVSEASRLGPLDVCSDELYAFHTSTSSWEFLHVRGDAPSARGGASLNAVRGSLVLFGGESSDGTYNDIYKFEPRSGHAAASDGEKIYIFGGYNECRRWGDLPLSSTADVLEFSLCLAQLQASIPVTCEAALRNGSDVSSLRCRDQCDVWKLDAQTYTWTLLSAGDPKFAPRERHGAVILKVRPATVAAEAIELDTFAFFSLIFSTRHSPAVGEESVRAEARVLLALAFAVLAGLPTIVGRSAAALMGLIKANAKAMAVCSGV
ncbi:Chromosome III, complete sequence, related [Eimeria acervulina]|uniref:Chromosome III, complete sequence, related n=1 Tax=Eimeria acervulina TaxID=5801 RepID=U6GXP1_EIMAC|nr:Chromosome III, complete sequence, related [Eimeria acervulina]CDI83314.1 Chromosome III, complete sequence, related [Eimeria acervulina]